MVVIIMVVVIMMVVVADQLQGDRIRLWIVDGGDVGKDKADVM